MSAVAEPRFVVRELEGFPIKHSHSRVSGLTVWVADETYNGREVRVWRSEDHRTEYTPKKLARIRAEAAELAASLNAGEHG